MPRFFFDIDDNGSTIDEEGTELPDLQAVRAAAVAVLPRIAADEMPITDKDRRHFAVLVTDNDGKGVYAATLTFTGMWLQRRER